MHVEDEHLLDLEPLELYLVRDPKTELAGSGIRGGLELVQLLELKSLWNVQEQPGEVEDPHEVLYVQELLLDHVVMEDSWVVAVFELEPL